VLLLLIGVTEEGWCGENAEFKTTVHITDQRAVSFNAYGPFYLRVLIGIRAYYEQCMANRKRGTEKGLLGCSQII
jgi:hypothetical protein